MQTSRRPTRAIARSGIQEGIAPMQQYGLGAVWKQLCQKGARHPRGQREYGPAVCPRSKGSQQRLELY